MPWRTTTWGSSYKDQGKLGEAIASFRRALTLKLDSAETYSNLAGALMDQGRLDEAVAGFRRILTLKPDFAGAHSNLLFCLNYLPHISQQEIYRAISAMGRAGCKDAA